jgi:UDP-N-acetylglucosamine acyltransferase
MIGGHTKIVQDVPPYVLVDGANGNVVGLNLVGLRRNGFVAEEISELKNAYRLIYRRGLKWREVIEQLRSEFPDGPAADFYAFLSQGTRGFVQERRLPPAATIKIRRAEDDDNEQGELHSKAG